MIQNLPSAKLIAKYFVWKANKDNKKITNKKIQKLLYYSQAWDLALKGHQMFRENIEAWIHGPAIRSVYNDYREFGFNDIQLDIKESEIAKVPDKDVLEDVWRVYGKYDGNYLEALTHSEQPWLLARENLDAGESSNNVISLESMENYYKGLLQKK